MLNKLHTIACIIAIALTLISSISLVYRLIHNTIVFNRIHVVPEFPTTSYWLFIIAIAIAFILSFIPKNTH